MFAAALFDMDGLLLDSERAIMRAWMQVARERAVRLSPERYATVVGRNAAEATALLAPLFGGPPGLQQARQQVQALLQAQAPEERFALKPGVTELLAWLAAREVPCAVASSSSRHEIEQRLALAGVRGHFRAVAGGDEVQAGKPDPAVYLLAAERVGLPAPDCIAFEDSPNGARAALAAGATLVLVPDLVRPPVALARRSLCVLPSLQQALPQAPRWFPSPDPDNGW
jgi:HAD superfamily hydrolase (TIGR01509 family)